MEGPVRIGIAGLDDRRLREELDRLPARPEARVFGDFYDDVESVLQFAPHVLFLGAHGDSRDLPGALRLLRSLTGGLPVVVVAPAGREVELGPICRRGAAHLLLQPLRPGAVAAVLEQALLHSDRPGEEVFLDLARGFADEINNPLMFLGGHLQLLLAQCEPGRQGRGKAHPRLAEDGARVAEFKEQVEAAIAGAARIQATVDRIRQLSRAAAGPRRREPIELDRLLAEQLPRREAPAVVREPEAGPFTVRGDPELLPGAIALFTQVARELHELAGGVHFVLTRVDGGVRLRLQSDSPGLVEWRLPRTYEPYYLNRLLSGTSHGLSLFLVQTTVHGHGGQATARRMPDGVLALDLVLPTGA